MTVFRKTFLGLNSDTAVFKPNMNRLTLLATLKSSNFLYQKPVKVKTMVKKSLSCHHYIRGFVKI